MARRRGFGLAALVVALSGAVCGARADPQQQVDGGPGDSGPADECDAVDAGHDDCPGSTRARCRLERLRRSFAECTSDTDCTFGPVPSNCFGYAQCQPWPAVTAGRWQAFSGELTQELAVLCAGKSCGDSGGCAPVNASAVCVAGTCATRVTPRDGGP